MAKTKKKASKKVAKKKVIKKAVKSTAKKVSHEIVVRVQPPEVISKTLQDLVEPMKDGKKMALTKTWVSSAQLIKIVQRTPAEHIYTRPGKGGGTFSYVTGNYVTKVLNFVFGWNWDFDVKDHGIEGNQVWVKGMLTVKSADGESISKSQFGRADIKFKKNTKEMLDFGNDLKAATTDALKKCASMLGIASDVYGKMEYKQEANVEVPDVQYGASTKKVSDVQQVVADLKDSIAGPEGEPIFVCSKCDDMVDPIVANYSKKMFGKILCREDQKTAKRK